MVVEVGGFGGCFLFFLSTRYRRLDYLNISEHGLGLIFYSYPQSVTA